MMSARFERAALVVLELFNGLMAIVGTVGLLSGAWSEGVPVEWLRGSPFTSYLVPALALLVFVGGSSFLAAMLLILRNPWGIPASLLAGGILVSFEIVEYLVIGLTFFLQPLMFAIGVLLIALGARLLNDEQVSGQRLAR
jgi:hypothetical protein